MAGLLAAAEPRDEIKAAAKALSGKANYTWKSDSQIAGMPFNPGPTVGKTEKSGFTVLSQEIRGEIIEAVLKETNGVVKTDEGWMFASELFGPGRGAGDVGGLNPARIMGRLLLSSKNPAEQIENILEKIQEAKKDGAGVVSGNLTAEGAKELMSFGRRRRPGANGANGGAEEAKGSVKVWMKDGVLARYELFLSGTISFGGEERAIERTTTVEIKEVGTTRVQVPDAARQKLLGGSSKP
jgi:hypothetical protein